MATNLENKRRLRACRRLAVSFPDRTAKERLKKIADIASGKAAPTIARPPSSPDLQKRLAEGQASRARGNAHDRRDREAEEEEKARKKRGTRNRQQASGRDRGES